MNRRDFIRSLFLGAAAVTVAPVETLETTTKAKTQVATPLEPNLQRKVVEAMVERFRKNGAEMFRDLPFKSFTGKTYDFERYSEVKTGYKYFKSKPEAITLTDIKEII